MRQAHVVVDERAWDELAITGVTFGWLKAWLRGAGADEVLFHRLRGNGWIGAKGWMLVLADESEFGRVVLQHGRRLGMGEDGARSVVGGECIELDNPPRRAWFYMRDRQRWPTLLMPPGDVAYQRFAWLPFFSGDREPRPVHVYRTPDGRGDLEPGLSTREGGLLLNDCGFLPEEMVVQTLHRTGLCLVTAESCTAGRVAGRVARVPGASRVLWGGMVTYANEAKTALLGVGRDILEEQGAVSRPCVEAMALGGLRPGCVSLAVSGVAGPGGGSEEKPVGTVWMAIALPDGSIDSRSCCLEGGRASIQAATTVHALSMLLERLGGIQCV